MLKPDEVNEAIAELKAQRNHNPDEIVYLASLCTVRDKAFEQPESYQRAYSHATAPTAESPVLGNYGDSDFLVVITGKAPEDAWKVMDKLMDTLRLSFPKAYNRVMREMREL